MASLDGPSNSCVQTRHCGTLTQVFQNWYNYYVQRGFSAAAAAAGGGAAAWAQKVGATLSSSRVRACMTSNRRSVD